MATNLRSSLIAAGLLASLPAMASIWEWEEEIYDRDWRPESLDWAAQSHSSSPSPIVLLTTTAPPPREMWCAHETEPTLNDCDTFDALLEDWSADYLGLSSTKDVPQAMLNAFPSECDSICQ